MKELSTTIIKCSKCSIVLESSSKSLGERCCSCFTGFFNKHPLVTDLEQQLSASKREVVETIKMLGDECRCEHTAAPYYIVVAALEEHFKEKCDE